MSENTHKTIRTVVQETESAKRIGALLEQMGERDPEALLLSIESETNLPEAIAALYDAILEHELYLAGCKEMIKNLGERRDSMERAIETMKGVIFLAMEKANLPQVKHPCATISVRNTPPQMVITDESTIPAEFWKRADPTLDKTALKDALKSGTAIPGAVMSNGGRALAIRVK